MSIQTLTSATVSTTLAAPPEAPVRSAPANELTSSAPVTKPADKVPVSETQLQSAVDAANEFVKPINNSVEFNLDKDSGEMIVKVIDTGTKEVIRQIPSEEMLALAKALDKIQGLLIKQKA